MNAYAYLSLVAIAVNLVAGVYVLSRGPRLKLNRLVFAVLMCLVAWASGEFVMRTAETTRAALRGSRVAGLGWCLIGPIYLVFVLAYTEKDRLLRNPLTYIVLFLPGLFFLVTLWTTHLIFVGFKRSYWGYLEHGGALRLPSEFYVALMFLIGVALLFQYWRKARSQAKRSNTVYILVASLIPICVGLITDIILPLANVHIVELTMFASTAVGPVLSYAIVSHGLLTTITGSLGSTIITKIREAVFVTDAEGLIETVNPAAQLLTGYTADELLETPIAHLLVEEHQPNPRTSFLTGPERPWAYCISKFGERIPVTVSTEAVKRRTGSITGSITVVHDMRDALRLVEVEREATVAEKEVLAERGRSETLRRSREELKQISNFLENVIDNIAEPLFIKDLEGRYVFVNKSICEASGLLREQIIGKTNEEIPLVPEDRAALTQQLEAEVKKTGAVVKTDIAELKDQRGDSRFLKTVRAPLKNEAGEVEFIVGIISDVTEERRLDKARLDFIRVAAHELRTPLTSLKLGFELLARETRGALDKDQQRSLDVLSLSIERLSSLAKNLLDLAGMDAGLLTLNRQPVDIEPLMGEAAALFSGTIATKGLYCDVAVDGNLRPAYADASRLSQVLYNLVSNAVKYTETGGIVISARDPGDDFLEICVADTGVGISPGERDSIFTSFVKVRDASGAREGTGLGLSITKAIVEAHGGAIRVQSAPGEGSKFHFTVQAFD